MYMLLFFCFKQKTAYEMRISDWSSDVCSSDLLRRAASAQVDEARRALGQIDRKIAKLVSAITDGGPAKALTAAIQKLEAEQDALQALLDSAEDRKSGVSGKSGSVSVDLGGRRIHKKKRKT